MEIDAVDSGSPYCEDLDTRECHSSESQARVLDEKNGIHSLQFETRQQGDFSLRVRRDGIKPMMHCIREVDPRLELNKLWLK